MSLRLAAVVVLLAGPAAVRAADTWTSGELAVEATFAALVALDYSQTRYALAHPPAMTDTVELNPILPRRPSRATLATACVAAIGVHAAVSHYLPRQWRRAWLVGTVIGEGANVTLTSIVWGIGFSY